MSALQSPQIKKTKREINTNQAKMTKMVIRPKRYKIRRKIKELMKMGRLGLLNSSSNLLRRTTTK